MKKALFLSLTIAAVALSGCTDAPAAGTFTVTAPAADFSAASVTIDATPASNSYPANDPSGSSQECGLDAITGQDPTSTAPGCEDASSTVSFVEGGATMPIGVEGTPYTMYIVDAEGNELMVNDFEHHGEGHYDMEPVTFDGVDLSGASEVQIRFSEAVIATAPGAGGTFDLAQGMKDVEATVTYDGAMIDIALVSAPNGTPLTAWLVDVVEEENEDGEMVATGEIAHEVDILITPGTDAVSYTLSEEEGFVGDYEYFHIHVGLSKINIATIEIPEPVEE